MADDCQDCEERDEVIKRLERERDSLASRVSDLEDAAEKASRTLTGVLV